MSLPLPVSFVVYRSFVSSLILSFLFCVSLSKMTKAHAVTCKSSRKMKGNASASIFINSNSDDLFPTFVASSLGKLLDDSCNCESCKKRNSNLILTVPLVLRLAFGTPLMNLFSTLKKNLVHGRVVDIDILCSLDCNIKKKLSSTVPKIFICAHTCV